MPTVVNENKFSLRFKTAISRYYGFSDQVRSSLHKCDEVLSVSSFIRALLSPVHLATMDLFTERLAKNSPKAVMFSIQ